MRLLVHICCAHCLAQTLAGLRAVVTPAECKGFFFNPNIHPWQEFRKRRRALEIYVERAAMAVEIDRAYGLVSFCEAIHPHYGRPERCRLCYRLRLERSAQRAAELGCDAFTTTMIASRHQDHALLRETGAAAGAAAGVAFLYRDLREAIADAKLVKGLYRQQYCGCVFSEAERYCGGKII